jgi:hypothetical protein
MNYLANVYSIVPRLPPAIDGVGDYALNLARQLRKDFNIQTHFIVGNPTWSGVAEIEGFPISHICDRNPNMLIELLNCDRSCPILLHYVGYGYDQRGCPVWLVDGLQRWKSLFPNCKLVTMFHELYASGSPPWTSSFWLSPLQKNLAAKLANLSDRRVTSRQSYAEELYRLAPKENAEIVSLPVFSTIGEPKYLSSLSDRVPQLVVFGSRNARLQVYNQCLSSLERICQLLDIKKILDIGVPTGLELARLIDIPVIEKGVLEVKEISQIMQDSIAGFLNFPHPTFLAKSTVFAAYCAHGIIPCMTQYTQKSMDGLQHGKHYWTDNIDKQLCLKHGQEIANNAYNWYHSHNLSRQVINFADNLISQNF